VEISTENQKKTYFIDYAIKKKKLPELIAVWIFDSV
jgi:hypothetical protein